MSAMPTRHYGCAELRRYVVAAVLISLFMLLPHPAIADQLPSTDSGRSARISVGGGYARAARCGFPRGSVSGQLTASYTLIRPVAIGLELGFSELGKYRDVDAFGRTVRGRRTVASLVLGGHLPVVRRGPVQAWVTAGLGIYATGHAIWWDRRSTPRPSLYLPLDPYGAGLGLDVVRLCRSAVVSPGAGFRVHLLKIDDQVTPVVALYLQAHWRS